MNLTDEQLKELLVIVAKYDDHESLWWNSDQFFINVSDVFSWATADLEEITGDDLPVLRQAYLDVQAVSIYKFYGSMLWACRKRGMRPQRPVWTKMEKPLQALFLAAGPERDPKEEG